jgi:CubicO group peptidase (beta-lactamase class C family)
MNAFQWAACGLLLFTSMHRHGQVPVAAPAPTAHPDTSQASAADVKTPAVAVAHPLESGDLSAFFDGIIPMQLERSDIAGTSVLVMKDGKTLLEKGYGYADVKTKKPVDPATTIFRLASISKLFTWVSVMQLEEQGKLDIDTDVNRYLDFTIRPAFDKPITLRNLMTHTSGFEEVDRDVIITDPKQAISLRDFLIQNQPDRMFVPGTVPAYSNYGVGLAGYIVQRVSGEPFEQYVTEHIFTPLGMTHSTFYQPTPKGLPATPSEGYRDDTTNAAVGFEIFNPAPAGGVSSTATDMSRLGQALLNGGELDGKRILKPETITAMWTPQFRASPDMPPICMGFYETWRNDVKWIGHEGDLIAFHSLFFLYPAQKLIVFTSYNSAGGGAKPRPELIDMFTDRYFPSDKKQAFLTVPRKDLTDIEGTYETTRRADSTRMRLGALFEQRQASVNKDGELSMSGHKDLRGHIVKAKPIGKDLWQEVDGQERVFAIRDESGKIVRLASDFAGVQGQRVPWYDNGRWVRPAAGISLLVLTLVVLAMILRVGRRIFLRKRARLAPQPGTLWMPGFTKLSALVWCVLLFSIAGFFAFSGDDLNPPNYQWDKYFLLMNVVTALAILLSVAPLVSALRVWRKKELRVITRVKYSLVALACVFLSWFAIHWHLIGPVRV